MSYVQEPYAQFVDDLLTALTGGVIREQFTFLPEQAPFRLAPSGTLVPATLAVFGQAGGAFARFRRDRDFTLTPDFAIAWKARADGTPAADAIWPDAGTPFFANYDQLAPSGAVPLLTDRNPGSVVRMLAESFAREYAVLSKQLESVYEAAFIETSTGRDLDQLVALVGVERRDPTYAAGAVVFSRATPAVGDIPIPAGTRVSTADSPVIVFETTETRTLHRGSLSVEAPVRATVPGPPGAVPARAIRVIHRPIFGIDDALNAQATLLGGAAETDDALRDRARRALEGAGKGTVGAMLAALATLPGVREKDVRLAEEHLKRPGVITLNVAATLDEADCVRAVQLIEDTRPAGVRVLHNLDCPLPLGSLTPDENVGDEEEIPADATTAPGALFFPVAVAAVLLPVSASLTPQERNALKRAGEQVVRAFVADAGIGETLVYNRLVAALIAIDGVLDVSVDLYPADTPPPVGAAPRRRWNVAPPATLRPSVDVPHGGALAVQVGGQLVALDVTLTLRLVGAGGIGDRAADLEDARLQVAAQLTDVVAEMSSLSSAAILALLHTPDTFTVDALTFTVEYVDAGVRVHRVFGPADAPIALSPLQRPWVRRVRVEEAGA